MGPLREKSFQHEGFAVSYDREVTEEHVRRIDELVREEFETGEWVTVEEESPELCGVSMADEPDEVEKVQEVRFLPPPQVWRYLGWLARHTVLGKTEQEVARQLLINKLAEMRQEDYRDPLKT